MKSECRSCRPATGRFGVPPLARTGPCRPAAAQTMPVAAPVILPTGSSVRRRKPQDSTLACRGPVIGVTEFSGWRGRRRRARPDPLQETPACCRVAARILSSALRRATAGAAVSAGGHARVARDRTGPRLSNQGSTSGSWPISPARRRRPAPQAGSIGVSRRCPTPRARRRRNRPSLDHPDRSEVVRTARQRPVRARFNGADRQQGVRAPEGGPAPSRKGIRPRFVGLFTVAATITR